MTSTWHLWVSEYEGESWSKPRFIDIPNLRGMLVSHPSIAPDGTLYFHASNPDYSNMKVYSSKLENGVYQDASKIEFDGIENGICTPYISNDGKYLFFAVIEKSLPLYYVNKEEGRWSNPIILPDEINEGSQANPFVTSDKKKLLLAKESPNSNTWYIEEVDLATILGN